MVVDITMYFEKVIVSTTYISINKLNIIICMRRKCLKEDLSQYLEIIEHNPNYIEEILGKYSFLRRS